MTDENQEFCVKCGARIPPDSTFCPECGVPIDGGTNPYASQCGTRDYGGGCCPANNIKTTGTFILIYGLISTLFGIMMVSVGLSMTMDLWNQMIEMTGSSMTISMEDFKSLATMLGAMLLASGVCALISGFLVGKGQKWMVSLVLCGAASILSFGFEVLGIVTCAIGLFMTYRIYRNKDSFQN